MLTIDEGDDDRLDLVYAALANRRRRQVVLTLSVRPASIAQLASQQGSSLPAFHRHVVALEEAGLVERRKSGRVTFLALTRSGLVAAQGWLGQFHSYWGNAGETLENYVAGIDQGDSQ
ncbi:MAG: winged helix-turn-helix domain-containing protein [Actinomycetota bacterium]